MLVINYKNNVINLDHVVVVSKTNHCKIELSKYNGYTSLELDTPEEAEYLFKKIMECYTACIIIPPFKD